LSSRDGVWAGLLGFAAAALYLSFTTKFYVFEGLARAMPIEAGRLYDVFLGNYLAYGAVSLCFHHFLGLFGPPPLAVVSMQVMDCLIGAAGISLFFLTLRRLDAERPVAALWSAILGTTCAYWMWSTDAQNYIFSSFLLLLNFHFLVRDLTGSKLPAWAFGVVHFLGMMGHIVNGMFGLVYLWHLSRTRGKGWIKEAAVYTAVVGALTLAAYLAVVWLVVKPESIYEGFQWFWGSLKKGRGGLRWHGILEWAMFRTWLKTSANALVSFKPDFELHQGGAGTAALLALARALVVAFFVRAVLTFNSLTGTRKAAMLLCLVWLGSYAMVFTSWEPHTMVYRVSDMSAVVALLFIASEAGPSKKAWRWAAVALAVCLGAGNFMAEIYPRSFAENNRLLVRMDFVRENTPDDSWVASPEGQGGGEELYLPFFARRRPIVLSAYREQPELLRKRLAMLFANKQSVFVTSFVLADPYWKLIFQPYKPAFVARDDDGVELFRIEAAKAPFRAARRRS
jgi:hypothetical protein